MKWANGGPGPTLENSQHKYYDIQEFGYLRWREYSNGEVNTAYVHQLVFLAHNPDVEPEQVFSDGEYVVHHGSDRRFSREEAKCPLFNWGSNLKLEEPDSHGDYHMNSVGEKYG